MISRKFVFLTACLCTLCVFPNGASAQDSRLRKKLIETSGLLNTIRLRQNLAAMEQQPFDGVVFDADGFNTKDRKSISLRPAFINERWPREWFQNCVDDLKACKFKRFTDNFVQIGANPGNVDWFDDAGWARIAEHWRIAAWIAKEGGVKGILFDPEAYTSPYSQFGYRKQPQQKEHSFSEYYAKARERGRQVMRAAVEENPEMVLLCYFMDSMTFMAVGQPNVQAALQNDDYGLYPAFIDGWLEVIPPTVTLVDGGENAYLYLYDSPNQYLAAAAMVRGAGQELVSPELRAKYRAQVQVGFGFFLDAYRNPPSTWFNIQAKAGGSRVDRLRENVSTALRVADEYVWIYGHLSQGQWWPPSNTNHWSKTLPGCEEALRSAREFVRDPIKYGRAKVEEMKNAGTLVNLMINGDFSLEEAKTQGSAAADWVAGPAGWFFTAAKGTCAWDRAVGATAKGSARTVEVNSGCLVQKVAVKPGEHYAVRTVCKLQGQGSAWVRISWQSPEEKWAKGECDKQFFPAGSAKEWEEIFGIVEVPEGVGQLGILLSVSGETSPEDMAWFDDVQLCKLR